MKIVEQERKKNYRLSRTDVFRHRCRYFSDSGIIGSKEFVSEVFDGVKHLLDSKDEQWKQEGEVKGRVEGRQDMLQRLVNKRFGQNILDFHNQEQLRKATLEQLDLWAERILDAKNVDEVFKDN